METYYDHEWAYFLHQNMGLPSNIRMFPQLVDGCTPTHVFCKWLFFRELPQKWANGSLETRYRLTRLHDFYFDLEKSGQDWEDAGTRSIFNVPQGFLYSPIYWDSIVGDNGEFVEPAIAWEDLSEWLSMNCFSGTYEKNKKRKRPKSTIYIKNPFFCEESLSEFETDTV